MVALPSAFPATRRCSSCKRKFLLNKGNFLPSKKLYDAGFERRCRRCEAARARKWQHANREKCAAAKRRWRAHCKAQRMAELEELREESIMLFHLYVEHHYGVRL